MRVLVSDDHWVARAAILSLLPMLNREYEVHEAATAQDTLHLVQAQGFDLIIIDLNYPDEDPWSFIPAIRREAELASLIVISFSEAKEDVLRCLQYGVAGYVPKSSPPEDILSTMRRVLAGEVSLPYRLLADQSPNNSALAPDREFLSASNLVDDLTPRQKEIFELLADRLSNAEIAEALGLSPNTVRVHIQALLRRLGDIDRSTAASYAVRFRNQYA